MRHSHRLVILVIIMAPILACQAAVRLVTGQEQTSSPTPAPSPISAPAGTDAVCPIETGMILRAANSESLPPGRFPAVDTSVNLDVPLVTYEVSGDELLNPVLEDVPRYLVKYQTDYAAQQNAWRLFTALIPRDQRSMLGQFQIMTDGPGGVLSAVEQTGHDPSKWVLETDIADIPDSKNFAFTLLHEFGHLLTLGPSQVPPNLQVFSDPTDTRIRERALSACSSYFPGEGCSLPTSYVNVFFDRFWKDLYGEWSIIDRIEEDDRKDAKLRSFYRKYRGRFVDSYAVTSPVEDIAESWAYFILSPRPVGTSVIDEKLRFFYEYPKLVDLRSSILHSLCAAKP